MIRRKRGPSQELGNTKAKARRTQAAKLGQTRSFPPIPMSKKKSTFQSDSGMSTRSIGGKQLASSFPKRKRLRKNGPTTNRIHNEIAQTSSVSSSRKLRAKPRKPNTSQDLAAPLSRSKRDRMSKGNICARNSSNSVEERSELSYRVRNRMTASRSSKINLHSDQMKKRNATFSSIEQAKSMLAKKKYRQEKSGKVVVKSENSLSNQKRKSAVIDQECLIIFKNDAEVIPYCTNTEESKLSAAPPPTKDANSIHYNVGMRNEEEQDGLLKHYTPILLRYGWEYDRCYRTYYVPLQDSSLTISTATLVHTLQNATFYNPSIDDLKLCIGHNSNFQEEIQVANLEESLLCNVLIKRNIDTSSSVRYSCSSAEGFEELIDGYNEVIYEEAETEPEPLSYTDFEPDPVQEIDNFIKDQVSLLFTDADCISDAIETELSSNASNSISENTPPETNSPLIVGVEEDKEIEEPRLRRSTRSATGLPTKFREDFVSDIYSESQDGDKSDLSSYVSDIDHTSSSDDEEIKGDDDIIDDE
jgi:hypothetical protein